MEVLRLLLPVNVKWSVQWKCREFGLENTIRMNWKWGKKRHPKNTAKFVLHSQFFPVWASCYCLEALLSFCCSSQGCRLAEVENKYSESLHKAFLLILKDGYCVKSLSKLLSDVLADGSPWVTIVCREEGYWYIPNNQCRIIISLSIPSWCTLHMSVFAERLWFHIPCILSSFKWS